MVSNLELKLGVLLTLFSLSFSCIAEENIAKNKIILSIDNSSAELGRPIRVNLYGINLKKKISNIDLTPLKYNSGVIVDYFISDTIDNRWPNQHVQLLKLKLFPKMIGEIIVPKLYFNNHSTKEQIVHIEAGETSSPMLNVSINAPYEQQQFIAYITIQTPSPTSRLRVDSTYKIKNFDSTPIDFIRNKKHNGLYELRIGWALTPLISGKIKINLPPIDYIISGVSRKKFFIPAANLKIKKLPLYLPPTIPIGKVDIKSSISKTGILTSNEMYYLNIELSGKLSSSYKLPPILRGIKSNSKIKFFPAITNRKSNKTYHNLTSIVKHSIPFKPLKSGILSFPEIKIQYYDPASEKITTNIHSINNIYVLNIFLKLISFLILLLIVVYLVKLIYKKWQMYKIYKSKIELALQELQGGEVTNIHNALGLLIEAESWERNITVTQWGNKWKNKYHTDDSFDTLVENLSSCFYSSSDLCCIKDLSRQLEKVIKNKKVL